jgi:hypothetical protein
MTVGDLARRYRGSAGGRALDIGALDLAQDDATGLKWIQYVRFERSGTSTPEIDAIADVSPASPHSLWTLKNFAWLGDPADEAAAADPDGDAEANLAEYAMGGDPTNAAVAPDHAARLAIDAEGSRMAVSYELATNAVDVGVEVQRAMELGGDWQTNGVTQVAERVMETNGRWRVTATAPADAQRAYLRVRTRDDR